MNIPGVCDAVLTCLNDLPLPDVVVVDGGVLTSNPPDKFIELLGTEDGDEEWLTLGPESRARRYSLGLQIAVAQEGMDDSITKAVREEAFRIFELAREALQALPIIDTVASVQKPLEVAFADYQPMYTTQARIAYIGAVIRVQEKG